MVRRRFSNHTTCPYCGSELATTDLTPNFALRDSIQEFKETFCKMIDSSHVRLIRQIGQGSFKVVHEAELLVPGSAAPTVVAASVVSAADVGAEAEVLLGLGQHPHLVRFLGMFRTAHEVTLITELAPLGSLDNHLHDDDVEDSITQAHRRVIISQVRRARRHR